MIHYVKGDLLEGYCDCICHQVNCQGRMGFGVAKQIRERYPEVYETYLRRYQKHCDNRYEPLLGTIDVVYIHNNDNVTAVINMYSQDGYGRDGKRYTSYDAFADALHEIRQVIPEGYKIGFPKNIGCGLGGGNWNVISALIEEILGDDYDIYIYELVTCN